TIKHDSRFLNDAASELLAQLLDPILKEEWPGNNTAIKTIASTDANPFLSRGRLANDLSARKSIYRSPIRQLSAPPPHLNTAGRMNVAGITNFYGSFDRNTCVAELRTAVGGQGARHVTEARHFVRRSRHRYRQELVPHRWPESARCYRAAAEVV